jgi:hypothetical protein
MALRPCLDDSSGTFAYGMRAPNRPSGFGWCSSMREREKAFVSMSIDMQFPTRKE